MIKIYYCKHQQRPEKYELAKMLQIRNRDLLDADLLNAELQFVPKVGRGAYPISNTDLNTNYSSSETNLTLLEWLLNFYIISTCTSFHYEPKSIDRRLQFNTLYFPVVALYEYGCLEDEIPSGVPGLVYFHNLKKLMKKKTVLDLLNSHDRRTQKQLYHIQPKRKKKPTPKVKKNLNGIMEQFLKRYFKNICIIFCVCFFICFLICFLYRLKKFEIDNYIILKWIILVISTHYQLIHLNYRIYYGPTFFFYHQL
jgi:hypothetical protein